MSTSPDNCPTAEFSALHGFDSVLSARTEVSPGQAERLRALPLGDLDGELRASAEIIKRLADAVAAAMQEPARATSFLDTLDLRVVTRDHDWRAIFNGLREQASVDGQPERVALRNYLAYLCSRRDLVESVVAQRRALERTAELPALDLEPRPTGLVRLPQGEAVIIKLPYRDALTLRLGRHDFTLADGYPPRLVDPDGGSLKLRRGAQRVGRHPASDLVTGAGFPDVSRAHLELEWNGDSHVAITDCSTHGTFVDAAALATGPVTGPCSPSAVSPRPGGGAAFGTATPARPRPARTDSTRTDAIPVAQTRFVRGD